MEVPSPWEFGWEALVAISTFVLAAGTFWLALSTRRLARTTSEDLEAQWRPLLIPGSFVRLDPNLNPEAQRDVLELEVQNAGRGPAMYVRVHLDPGGVSPEDWSLGVIAPDSRVKLVFRGVRNVINNQMQLLLDYRDLSERTFSSTVVITPRGSEFVFYDVHLYRDHSVTALGDAVPQPGLGDHAPKPGPKIAARVGAALSAFRKPPGA